MAGHTHVLLTAFDVDLNFIRLSADRDLYLQRRLPSAEAQFDELITYRSIMIL
jgi:hypothetical protein